MKPTTIRTIFAGAIGITAVGGGIAYALVAQSHGQSPEPPTWLALLIGSGATYFFTQASNLNGSEMAVQHFAAAVTARRASDSTPAAAPLSTAPTMTVQPTQPGGLSSGAPPQGTS